MANKKKILKPSRIIGTLEELEIMVKNAEKENKENPLTPEQIKQRRKVIDRFLKLIKENNKK